MESVFVMSDKPRLSKKRTRREAQTLRLLRNTPPRRMVVIAIVALAMGGISGV
jgi:hypothetical protein